MQNVHRVLFLFIVAISVVRTAAAGDTLADKAKQEFGIQPAAPGSKAPASGPGEDLVVVGDPHARPGGSNTGGNSGSGSGGTGAGGTTPGGTGTPAPGPAGSNPVQNALNQYGIQPVAPGSKAPASGPGQDLVVIGDPHARPGGGLNTTGNTGTGTSGTGVSGNTVSGNTAGTGPNPSGTGTGNGTGVNVGNSTISGNTPGGTSTPAPGPSGSNPVQNALNQYGIQPVAPGSKAPASGPGQDLVVIGDPHARPGGGLNTTGNTGTGTSGTGSGTGTSGTGTPAGPSGSGTGTPTPGTPGSSPSGNPPGQTDMSGQYPGSMQFPVDPSKTSYGEYESVGGQLWRDFRDGKLTADQYSQKMNELRERLNREAQERQRTENQVRNADRAQRKESRRQRRERRRRERERKKAEQQAQADPFGDQLNAQSGPGVAGREVQMEHGAPGADGEKKQGENCPTGQH